MKEQLIVNWWLIVSPLLFVAGSALILSYLSFSLQLKKISEGAGKLICLSGIILALSGLLVWLVAVENTELASWKLIDKNPRIYEIKQGNHELSSDKLKVVNGNKKDGAVIMVVNGYIETPLYIFRGSDVKLSLRAKGSFCKGEYTILKVVYEELNVENVFGIKKKRYIELNAVSNEYETVFSGTMGKTGRFKILFVNDDYDLATKKDRNLWIESIKLVIE